MKYITPVRSPCFWTRKNVQKLGLFTDSMEFFLNGAELSLNSVISANSTWAQFQDTVSHMCLAGAVVASWTLTQEVADLSPFTLMTNILSLNPLNSV